VGHGTFAFGAADTEAFRAKLIPAQAQRAARVRARLSSSGSGYVIYSYGNFDIAVDWQDRKGEFWIGPTE
jgi:hypothetical protein